jgi:hypothetical protein
MCSLFDSRLALLGDSPLRKSCTKKCTSSYESKYCISQEYLGNRKKVDCFLVDISNMETDLPKNAYESSMTPLTAFLFRISRQIFGERQRRQFRMDRKLTVKYFAACNIIWSPSTISIVDLTSKPSYTFSPGS